MYGFIWWLWWYPFFLFFIQYIFLYISMISFRISSIFCQSNVFFPFLIYFPNLSDNSPTEHFPEQTYIYCKNVRTVKVRTLNFRIKKFGRFLEISDKFRTKFWTKYKTKDIFRTNLICSTNQILISPNL